MGSSLFARRQRLLAGTLPARQQGFVILVRADPEPDDLVRCLEHADCPVAPADTNRYESCRAMDMFEVQAGMSRVRSEQPVRGTRLFANIGRERGKVLPETLRNVRLHNASGSSSDV